MLHSFNFSVINKKKMQTQGLGISPTVLTSCGLGGTSCSAMVKDLAVAVFGRETLASHGLSGRADNANKDTTAKPALDQDKVMLILGELNHPSFFFSLYKH